MADQPLHIFICGAHSTGKTTLVNHLAKRIPMAKVETEVARRVIRESNLQRDDFFPPHLHPEVFEKLQADILISQHHVIQKHLDDEVTLFDRGVDPLMYGEFYLGRGCYNRLAALPEFQADLIHYRSSAILFVIHPHAECIEEDGIRLISSLEDAERLTQQLIKILKRLEITYHEIKNLDMDDRVAMVLAEISNRYQSNARMTLTNSGM